MSRRVLPFILLCTIAAVMAALLWPRPGPAAATGGVTTVDAGGYHTCAITAAGGVKCWGNNGFGQLGDGTTTDNTTPVDVTGLASGVTAISAGVDHTCALTTAGGVKCWGGNGSGQLGDGQACGVLPCTTPVGVSGLASGVTAISAGADHTCALTTAGGVKCWGDNDSGELGDGTTTNSSTPVAVSGLGSGVAAISAGTSHTCALLSYGSARCWGLDNDGQLGDGTTTNRTTPVAVSGLSNAVAIAAGAFHACALTTAGGVECWGYNYYGQLGDGTTVTSGCYCEPTPAGVSGLASGVAAISGGAYHTCAVTIIGGAKCWGWNYYGQLGDGTITDSSTPVDVSGLTSGIAAVSAGHYHTCALTTAGGVKCWGSNFYGQLGDGTNTERHTPVDVSSLGPKPTPTSTPTTTPATPGPVGGISLDPQLPGSSERDAGLLAGAIAGSTAVALGGGVWYTRRRRTR